MTQFEALFGIKSSSIKKNCILLPMLPKGILNEFKIGNFKSGKLYGTGDNDDFTLIHTGMGAGFTGDAVLHLKESPCENVILFGSCGLVKARNGLSIGSLVSPAKCYANESFTDLLLEKNIEPKVFYAQDKFLGDFLAAGEKMGLKKVNCSTLASLKLEEQMVDSFIEKGIDVVDMECSAFLSAAAFSRLNAIACFYVSDIIKDMPFYLGLDPDSKSALFSAIKDAAGLICEFAKKKSSV
jgi:purine-nucleoside phosphorylase